jgi:hypothetical protein
VIGFEINAETAADDKFDIRALNFVEQVKQCRLKLGHRNHCFTG